MKTCEACGREFELHRSEPPDCPWCGYDNSRADTPYSPGYLKRLEEKREQEERDASRLWFEGDDDDLEEE